MHDMQTVAIDDPVAWASVSLSHASGECSYSFARWRQFDAAVTPLLQRLVCDPPRHIPLTGPTAQRLGRPNPWMNVTLLLI